MGKQKRKHKHIQRRGAQEAYNPHLKELILQVVESQITGQDEDGAPVTTVIDGEPDCVKNTFERLSAIHGQERAKEMIAAVLLEEMYDTMKYLIPFNEPRYREKLERLR